MSNLSCTYQASQSVSLTESMTKMVPYISCIGLRDITARNPLRTTYARLPWPTGAHHRRSAELIFPPATPALLVALPSALSGTRLFLLDHHQLPQHYHPYPPSTCRPLFPLTCPTPLHYQTAAAQRRQQPPYVTSRASKASSVCHFQASACPLIAGVSASVLII